MTKATGDANAEELYSRTYLRSSTAQRDSKRFRTRLSAWFFTGVASDERTLLVKLIPRELGVRVPLGQGPVWMQFFESAELRDLLDTISLIHRVLEAQRPGKATAFRTFLARAFDEESLGYVINDAGGVRYRVDAEYERNRFSMIDGLGDPRYAAVKDAAESAFKRLDSAPFDTKAAVREMFEAVEILAKLMASTHEDLDERMVRSKIKPMANKLYAGKPSSASFSDQMLESLVKWVNAGHRYRHGQQTEEPVEPPMDMAVWFLSAGASHLRALVSLDSITRMLS
jgi:hypothetical protein